MQFLEDCCFKPIYNDAKSMEDIVIFFLSIVMRKRKASSAAQPNSNGEDRKVAEKVRYAAGRGSVKLGQNVAYDETKYKYKDEAVYEVPT